MEIEISKDYNVRKLKKWLNYELSTSMLFFLNFAYGFSFILIILAAVIFTPFLLKTLYEEERFGWLIFFAIIVGLPLVSLLLFANSQWFSIAVYIPIGTFYLYCFILRLAVSDW